MSSNEIFEVESIEFIIGTYTALPKTERTYLYLSLLNTPIKLSLLGKRLENTVLGYNIKLKDYDKDLAGDQEIMITQSTDVGFLYQENRIIVFIDLSQSTFEKPQDESIFGLKRIEQDLVMVFKDLIYDKKEYYQLKLTKATFEPKYYFSFVSSACDNELNIVAHDIYLEKTSFVEFIKSRLMKKLKVELLKTRSNNQIKRINYILLGFLNLLDLMPRFAAPFVFMFTDANYCLSNLGGYHNPLMQLTKADITVQMFDIERTSDTILNEQILGFAKNSAIMRYIAEQNGGRCFDTKELRKSFITERKYIFTESFFFQKKKERKNTEKPQSKGISKYIRKNIGPMKIEKNHYKKYYTSGLTIREIGDEIKENFLKSYELEVSLNSIIMTRLKENWYLLEKEENEIAFGFNIFPDATLKYKTKKIEPDKESYNFFQKIKIEISLLIHSYNLCKMKTESNEKKNMEKKLRKISKFIEDVCCTDKIIEFFIHNFADEKSFSIGKEISMNPNTISMLLGTLAKMPSQSWVRFFNVEVLEIVIKNQEDNYDYDDFTSNEKRECYFNEGRNRNFEIVKSQLSKYSTFFSEAENLGFKFISKYDNNYNKKIYINGFVIFKYDWIYDNLCTITFGFFECFLQARKAFKDTLIKGITEKGKLQQIPIEFNDKHLSFYIEGDINYNLLYNQDCHQPLRRFSVRNAEKNFEDTQKEIGSIFKHKPYQQVSNCYLQKKISEYKRSHFNMLKVTSYLILQNIRNLSGTFSITEQSEEGGSPLLGKKQRQIEKIKSIDNLNDIFTKEYIILYKLIIIPEKERNITEISIEPSSGFYLIKNNNNEFHFGVNEKFELKKTGNNLITSLKSLECIVEIENLRNKINTKTGNHDFFEDLNYGYSLLNKIRSPFMHKQTKSFTVLKNENIKDQFKEHFQKTSRIITLDFINDSNLTSFNEFIRKRWDLNYSQEKYKLPFWLKISIKVCKGKTMKQDNLKAEKLRIKIKWVRFFHIIDQEIINIINEELFKVIEVKVNKINQQFFFDQLRANGEYINKGIIGNSEKGVSNDKAEATSAFKKDLEQFFKKPHHYLFVIESHANDIYKYVRQDLNKTCEIKNVSGYYKIVSPLKSEPDQMFVFKVELVKKEGKPQKNQKIQKSNKSSTTLKNKVKDQAISKKSTAIIKQSITSSFASISGENPIIMNNKDEIQKDILFQLYGYATPSNYIQEKIKSIVNEKILLIKLNYYTEVLKDKEEIKKLPEYAIFNPSTYKIYMNPTEIKLENTKKVPEVMNYFYSTTLESWNKLITSVKMTSLDIELMTTFSDTATLTDQFPELEGLSELGLDYFNSLKEYYQTFYKGRFQIVEEPLKEPKIIIINKYDKSIENSPFCFLISLNDQTDIFKKRSLNKFELLKQKHEDSAPENLNELIEKDDKVSTMVYKFIGEMLYVADILYVNNQITF